MSFLFVNYTDRAGDTVVARYRADGDVVRPRTARVVLRIDQPFANHNGGQLQFGPDRYLYVGMGDGGAGNDPHCNAQRGGTLLGKLLRIDVDQYRRRGPWYGVPRDNPFAGGGAQPPEVWAIGLRNPWRFSFDRETGDLFIADVGQGAREEIDFQPAASAGGENYGWAREEGSLCLDEVSACPDAVPPCGDPALQRPILEYGRDDGSCAVIGGYVYRGSAIPGLAGAYLFGDFCSGSTVGRGARPGEASGASSSSRPCPGSPASAKTPPARSTWCRTMASWRVWSRGDPARSRCHETCIDIRRRAPSRWCIETTTVTNYNVRLVQPDSTWVTSKEEPCSEK